MIGKRILLTAPLAFLLAIFAACAAAASPTAFVPTPQTLDLSPAKIRFGYPTGIAFPTLIVARDRGFFAKENLTIEESQMGSSGLINDALATGNLDMGQTTPQTAMLPILKGAKMIQVSAFEYTFVDKSGKSWETSYIVVRSGEGIKKLTDLKGRKVAVNSLAGSGNYMLRAYMLRNHIDPDKDMTILAVPREQIIGAMTQKLVDAASFTADDYVQIQKQAKVDVIGTQTSLMNLDMDLSSTVSANTDFLAKNPDAVVRFLRAFIQARQWMAEDVSKNDGKTLLDLVGKAMKYKPEQAKSLYETRGGYYGKELGFVNLLDIPTRVITRNFEILKLNGFYKSDAPEDYARVVDIRSLKRAYETLGLNWDESKHSE